MENANVIREDALSASVVDADYFLQRIKRFEQKYSMDSYDFLVKYEKNPEEFMSADYSHWAFLCRNFFEELFLLEAESDSPPGVSPNTITERPDLESGFFVNEESLCLKIPAVIFKHSQIPSIRAA